MDEDRDRKFNKLRNKIIGTLKEYEMMLEKSEDPAQNAILKSTLKTLNKQLGDLEKRHEQQKEK